MYRALPIIVLMLCSVAGLYAQPAWTLKENYNWKFYQNGGLSFINNNPVADTSSARWNYTTSSGTVEAVNTASVSDAQGNLLFYTDAYHVWDKNHHPMPNGNDLQTGNALEATLILPVLENHDQYYIVHMSGIITLLGADPDAYQLRYTKVDMTLNNGLGDVVTSQKNILIASNLSGSMKAIPGNDCNIWLVTHDLYNTQFKVFEINASGINTTPVTSNVGNGVVGFMGPLSFIGNMAVSHDRSRLAFAQYGGDLVPIIELFDFNPSTAAITNAAVIDTVAFIAGYSLCFSPNNSKLYFSMLNPGETYPNNPNNLHIESSLFQYNISAGTPAAINNSRVLLSDSISSYNNVMRLGPNGKIYLASSYGGDTSTTSGYFYAGNQDPSNYSGPPFQAYVGCIQNPDVVGAGCNFNRKAVALQSYSSGAETMGGGFVKPYPNDTVFARHDTLGCNLSSGTMVLQSPSALSFHFEWDNGSTTAQRTVNASGTYWVRNGDYCHYRVDTFVVIMENINAAIAVNGLVLSTTVPYTNYQWLYNGNIIAGATASTYTVTQNGNYSVVVNNGNCVDTSAIYEATNVTGIDDLQRLAQQIKVYPNPAKNKVYISAPERINVVVSSIEGKEIVAVKNASVIMLDQLAKGIYFLRITDKNGALIKVEKLVKQE
ncbi:MAG: T9SS type A sorting domain-containing protein [Taibaiella sp.]|jgi:hypothetical protein